MRNRQRVTSGHPPALPRRTLCVQWKRILNGPRDVGRAAGLVATVAFALGGLLLIWSGYIHYHLWFSDGYRHIATIGPLFLLQSVAGLVLGVLVVALRRVWTGILGIGFVLMTLVGFLITVEHGLFGFTDSWQAPFAQQAFAIELAAAVLLGVGGALCAFGSAPAPTTGDVTAGISSNHT